MTRGEEMVADLVNAWMPGMDDDLDRIAAEADRLLSEKIDSEIVKVVVERRVRGER